MGVLLPPEGRGRLLFSPTPQKIPFFMIRAYLISEISQFL